MLVRLLVVWHLVELLGWLAAAAWLVDSRGWPWGGAVAGVFVFGFFGWRLLLNALSFAIASRSASPRPAEYAISPWRWIVLVVREAWVFTAAYGWYQLSPARFGRDTGRAQGVRTADSTQQQRVAIAAERPIVLLVHGYFCNGGVWAHYVSWFESIGFEVHTLSLEPIFADLASISVALEARVDALTQAFPNRRIHLVCHSMGGLVARAYVRRCGRERLGKVVTLGSPHRGTALAVLGQGENARQMRPDSAWMTDAANRPDLGDALAIYTYDDNLVSPRENATLPGMASIAFSGIGHLSLTASHEIFERVLSTLKGEAPE